METIVNSIATVVGILPTPKLSGGPVVGPQYERVIEKFYFFTKNIKIYLGVIPKIVIFDNNLKLKNYAL